MRHPRRTLLFLSLAMLLAPPADADVPPDEAQEQAAADAAPVLPPVEPSPVVESLLANPALDTDARRQLRLFHGQWDDLEPATPDEAARLALLRYDLDDAALSDPDADPLIRAEAALFAGRTDEVHALLDGADTIQAKLLRAEAFEQAGQLAEAVALLAPLRDRFQHETITDAAELTAAAEAIVMLAALEGRPSQDYRLALSMLGRATQELDPLYWPAPVAEAGLLMTKDNRHEAEQALLQALSLNPKAGEAWYELGRLAVDGYNFDAAAAASAKLREFNPVHPLADEIDIRSLLRQRDVASARRYLGPALKRFPERRELLALAAATEAMAYHDDALQAALGRFDSLSPGSPLALFTAGEYLSNDRQYRPAESLLRAAIERAPNWPAPRLELGLLMMQAGDLPAARTELERAAQLDPFHKAVNNQLRLARALLGEYATIETDHFIIRYLPGVDEVLARDMPGPLEEMYDEIGAVFQHRPPVKTQIDVMPDKSRFAVRITGMPDIWTIAAATGDVISITPPRSGPDQADPYNWVNVLRHEYVHTVTLSQTQNRVPHWFTEACAVSAETTGRTYDTCQLLTWALQNDKLFDYADINWGFIRPQTPRDRPLAYAQSDWMLEYIAHRWGHQAIVDLLNLYRGGTSDVAALKQVTALDADAFMNGFRGWARGEVASWGMDQREVSERAATVIQLEGKGVDTAELVSLLDEHGGDHPELLRIIAKRASEGYDVAEARRWVARYAAARPVDPWPFRALAKIAFDLGEPAAALGPLQMLERQDNYSAAWSVQLAKVYRDLGQLGAARSAITRALYCEPYNATYREEAATLALMQKDLDAAAFQVESLAILEPDRPQHPRRLAVIYERLGRTADAEAATARADAMVP